MIVYLLCVCVCVGGCMQEREREPFKLSFCMDLYQILARTGIILLTVIVLEHKNHTDIALKGVHWHNSAVRAQTLYDCAPKGIRSGDATLFWQVQN